jgi:hypothetical protein
MPDDVISATILGFAHLLAGGRAGETAMSFAVSRAWVDERGRPTEDGRRLVAALRDQRQTRSTFRLAV